MMPKQYKSDRDDANIVIIVQAVAIALAYFFEWLFSPSEGKKSK